MFSKNSAPRSKVQAMAQVRCRQFPRAFIAAAALLLVGCGEQVKVGQLGAVSGFLGGVVAQAPHAALVGRDILSAGGSAADAVAAGFFVMAVTYPGGAGLGGGGVCSYYDAVTNQAEILDFLPGKSAAGGTVGVPGAVRGMAMLHSRYGRLRWGRIVSPAETLARFGFPASRALIGSIKANRSKLAGADEWLKTSLFGGHGAGLDEGQNLTFVELAATLSRLRTKGVSDIYGGESGRMLVADMAKAGGAVTLADLREYRPAWKKTVDRKVGNVVVHFSPVPVSGELAKQLWDAADVDTGKVPAKIVHRPRSGDSAIVVADKKGSIAACGFTLNAPFGLARASPQTGMILAAAEANNGGDLAPIIAANHHVKEGYFAISGSGGPAGLAASVEIAIKVLNGQAALEDAIAAPRHFKKADGEGRYGEAAGDLQLGSVQAIYCSAGLLSGPGACRFVTDPRGHGMVAGEEF
jgi:gamma-glutamyltranspeptidase/glutathione hydrolase